MQKEFEENLINTLLKELITIYKSSEEKNLFIIIAIGVLLKLSDVKAIAYREKVLNLLFYYFIILLFYYFIILLIYYSIILLFN